MVRENGEALWFSKQILPALRKEAELRDAASLSPVRQHIGLYAFRIDALEKFCALPGGFYESLEGLEQLRLLENGINMQVVDCSFGDRLHMNGIDSQADIERAEKLLAGES